MNSFAAGSESRVDWRRRFFSVFVGNIPAKSSLGDLWRLFSKFGVVSNIFIPSKAERLAVVKGCKFGFVRFKRESEALKSLSDSLFLAGSKLNIKEAYPHPPSISRQAQVQSSKSIHDHNASRSFKEVLLSENHDGPETCEVQSTKKGFSPFDEVGICLDIPKKDMAWMEHSVMANLRVPGSLSAIYDGLLHQGIQVSLAEFSNSQVVITFSDKEEMDILLRDYLPLFQIWFSDFSSCSSTDLRRVSRCWVKIDNIPLSLWHITFFQYFGELWGKVIQIANISRLRKNFKSVWMELEVPIGVVIPTVFNEVVNGVHTNLRISLVGVDSVPKIVPDYSFSSDSSESSEEGSPAYVFQRSNEDLVWVDCGDPDPTVVDDEIALNLNSVQESDRGADFQISYCVDGNSTPVVGRMADEGQLGQDCGDRQLVIWDGSSFDNCHIGPNFGDVIGSEKEFVNGSVGTHLEEQPPPIRVDGNIMNGDGSLFVDLCVSKVTSPLPLKVDSIQQGLSKGSEEVEGFGGFRRGFIDFGATHNWSWIRKPRCRRNKRVHKAADDPDVEANFCHLASDPISSQLRVEAIKTLQVGKMIGLSFQEEDEVVIEAIIEMVKGNSDVSGS